MTSVRGDLSSDFEGAWQSPVKPGQAKARLCRKRSQALTLLPRRLLVYSKRSESGQNEYKQITQLFNPARPVMELLASPSRLNSMDEANVGD
jgi:hypothetical protein